MGEKGFFGYVFLCPLFPDFGGGKKGTGREHTLPFYGLVYETVLWTQVKRKGLKSIDEKKW